jgi:hypothetical protein
MPREVDERKKRAALRKLRRAADLAEKGLGPPLSDWEARFLAELEARIETYGSAFADPSKGDRGEALSSLQRQKLTEIDRKSRGKARRGMSRKSIKKSQGAPEAPDAPPAEPETGASAPPAILHAIDGPAQGGNVTRLKRAKPALRVIEGGRGQKDEG